MLISDPDCPNNPTRRVITGIQPGSKRKYRASGRNRGNRSNREREKEYRNRGFNRDI